LSESEQVPLTVQTATAYVNHLVIEFLRQEAAAFRVLVADETSPRLDRDDAALVAAAADQAVKQLVAVNNLIMAEKQLVQVASVIEVPGARGPRSLQ
jgi:hypothetical protein